MVQYPCPYVVQSAVLSADVYASPAKPVLAGVLPAPRRQQSRLSADIGRGRRAPPCCAVGRFVSRHVHVTGEFGSGQRVAGSQGRRSRFFADIGKERGASPSCAVGRFISRRVRVTDQTGSHRRVAGSQRCVKCCVTYLLTISSVYLSSGRMQISSEHIPRMAIVPIDLWRQRQ